MHEKAGAFAQAAHLYVDQGHTEAAAAAMLRAPEYLAAGKLYLRASNYKQAADAVRLHLESIEPTDDTYATTNGILGRCFYHLDLKNLAYEHLGVFLEKTERLDDSDAAAAAYVLGLLAEERGAKDRARQVLLMVSAYEPDYEDVAERLAGLVGASPQDSRAQETQPEPFVHKLEGLSVLKTLPMFEDLSLTELKAVHMVSEETSFAEGDILIEDGAEDASFFLILTGNCRVTKGSDEEEILLAKLGEGQMVGEMSMLEKLSASAQVTAEGAVSALRFDSERFNQLLFVDDRIAVRVYRSFAKTLAGRLRETNARQLTS